MNARFAHVSVGNNKNTISEGASVSALLIRLYFVTGILSSKAHTSASVAAVETLWREMIRPGLQGFLGFFVVDPDAAVCVVDV